MQTRHAHRRNPPANLDRYARRPLRPSLAEPESRHRPIARLNHNPGSNSPPDIARILRQRLANFSDVIAQLTATNAYMLVFRPSRAVPVDVAEALVVPPTCCSPTHQPKGKVLCHCAF